MTVFKLNPLAAAVAAALSLSAGQSMALTAFETPDINIYLSGASAPQGVLGQVANKLFDTAQGVFVFHDDNGTLGNTTDDGKLYRAYYGVVKNDTSITDPSIRGKKLLIIHRAKGGSVWGVNPVARAEAIATLKIADGTGNCVLVGSTYRCPEVGNDFATPTNPDANNRVPDFGVSDVEPAMFKGPNNVEFGSSALSDQELARLFQKGASSLMMGQVATNAVPTSLPLSRAAYGAMLTGSITNWNQVGNGSVSGHVAVCRRVQGSGTQATYNNYYNNFPCATRGDTPPARMSDSAGFNSTGLDLDNDPTAGTTANPIRIDPSVGYTVVENPSSGNVRDCLARAQSGAEHEFTGDDGKRYRVLFQNAPGTKAIGVLSLDSLGQENGWSFRGLDGAGSLTSIGTFACSNSNQLDCGIAPTKVNHREGAYDFAAELSFQYRSVAVGTVQPLGGLQKAAADQFIKFVGDPSVLDTLTGGAKEATIALPIEFLADGTNNVSKATRYGNSCAPLQKLTF